MSKLSDRRHDFCEGVGLHRCRRNRTRKISSQPGRGESLHAGRPIAVLTAGEETRDERGTLNGVAEEIRDFSRILRD